MQYLQNDRAASGRLSGYGWKVLVFGILAAALSIVVSIAVVQLLEPFIV